MFIFLGILPLINALFDFLSYALTLRLWRWGLRKNGVPTLAAAVDIAGALIIFTLLGITLILVFAGLNTLATGTLLDFETIFRDLRTPPNPGQSWIDSPQGKYLWLYAMLFSTLLPTLIHASLSSVTLWFKANPRFRAHMVTLIDRRDNGPMHEGIAMLALGLSGWLAAMLPTTFLTILGALIYYGAPKIGETYLQIFETLAFWLGQIPNIGPGYLPVTWPQTVLI